MKSIDRFTIMQWLAAGVDGDAFSPRWRLGIAAKFLPHALKSPAASIKKARSS